MASKRSTKKKKNPSDEIPFWNYFEKNITSKKIKVIAIIAAIGIASIMIFSRGGSFSADQLIQDSNSCLGQSCQTDLWQEKIQTINNNLSVTQNCSVDLGFRDKTFDFFQKAKDLQINSLENDYNELLNNLSLSQVSLIGNENTLLNSNSTTGSQRREIIEKYFNPVVDKAVDSLVMSFTGKSAQLLNYYKTISYRKLDKNQISVNENIDPINKTYSGNEYKIIRANGNQYYKLSVISIDNILKQDNVTAGYAKNCSGANYSVIKGKLNNSLSVKYQIMPVQKTSENKYIDLLDENNIPIISYNIDSKDERYTKDLNPSFYIQF